jgi:hypothetical protein
MENLTFTFMWQSNSPQPSLLGSSKLMINSSTQFYLLQGDSFVYIEESALGPLVGNDTVLRLVDGTTSPGRVGWSASTILFASIANVDFTNKPSTLMKNFEGNYLIMAVWNEEEMIFVNKILDPVLQLSDLELMAKLAAFAGSVPRFVLGRAHSVHTLDINHNVSFH